MLVYRIATSGDHNAKSNHITGGRVNNCYNKLVACIKCYESTCECINSKYYFS